jgi:hypothetical protein
MKEIERVAEIGSSFNFPQVLKIDDDSLLNCFAKVVVYLDSRRSGNDFATQMLIRAISYHQYKDRFVVIDALARGMAPQTCHENSEIEPG